MMTKYIFCFFYLYKKIFKYYFLISFILYNIQSWKKSSVTSSFIKKVKTEKREREKGEIKQHIDIIYFFSDTYIYNRIAHFDLP